jgi:hypothetical protein
MSEPTPQRSKSRLRAAVAVVAALIPLIPIAIGFSLGGGGGRAAAGTTTTTAGHFTPVAPPAHPAALNLLLPPGSGALVAQVVHSTRMRATPGGRTIARIGTQTQFGSPDAMWVERLSGAWLGVASPLAGNNRIGWIPAADASLSRVDWKLNVSLSARRLTVLDAGRTVKRFTIAIGAPSSPTPTGHFAVTDRLSTGDPAGPYGCCILALSALAPHAIANWDGGNRVAIHSTPENQSIGEDVSHGCMRLTLAEGRWLLDHIPIGTPALISSA